MAGEVKAVSADHLEFVDDSAMEALHAGGTIPVVLPGCSLFLDSSPAPARKLIDADLPVALATDLNPGSAMIESLPLVVSFACLRLKMIPTEALVAVTANAAAALGRSELVGGVSVGQDADLVALDVASLDAWPYHVGRNCVRFVVKKGRMVMSRATDGTR